MGGNIWVQMLSISTYLAPTICGFGNILLHARIWVRNFGKKFPTVSEKFSFRGGILKRKDVPIPSVRGFVEIKNFFLSHQEQCDDIFL